MYTKHSKQRRAVLTVNGLAHEFGKMADASSEFQHRELPEATLTWNRYTAPSRSIWVPKKKWEADITERERRTQGDPEIMVVMEEGQKVRRITNNPAEDVVPSWSDDGR